jgi:hypothetical protein
MQSYSFLLSLFAAMVLMSIFLWYGIFLEDNETIVAAINYGVFGKMGTDQFLSDYLTFLLPPLYFLSSLFDSIPVFGIYKLFNTFIAFFLLSFVSLRLLSACGASWGVSFLYSLLLVAFFHDSLFQIHCMRHSVILAFGSLLLYRTHWEETQKISVVAITFFFLALLNRIHAATLVLASFLIYDVLVSANLKQVIRMYLLPIIFALALVSIYQLNGRWSNNLGRYMKLTLNMPY